MSEIREIVRRLQEADQVAEFTENLTEMGRREDAPRQHEEIDAAANLEENLSALIRRDIPRAVTAMERLSLTRLLDT